MSEIKKEEKQTGWQIAGNVGCGILVWGAIILGCMGMFSCTQAETARNKQRVFDTHQPFLTANDSKVKILWGLPPTRS